MNKYLCWELDDGPEGEEGGVAVFAWSAAFAGKDFVQERWSKHYAGENVDRFEVNVKDEAGNVCIVDVSMDWDPVFYGTVREEGAP